MVAIRAIFFDYFGVISSDQYWNFVKVEKNVAGSFGELSANVNSGKITWQGFVAKLAELTGQPVEKINELYQSERINPEVVAFADALHGKYITGLVTNAHHEFLEPIVQAAHLNKVFDHVTVSSRVGATKPNPEIFKAACRQAGVEPEEVVFIDDIARNCDGAIKVGMRGIVFEDLPRLKLDLAKIGVRP